MTAPNTPTHWQGRFGTIRHPSSVQAEDEMSTVIPKDKFATLMLTQKPTAHQKAAKSELNRRASSTMVMTCAGCAACSERMRLQWTGRPTRAREHTPVDAVAVWLQQHQLDRLGSKSRWIDTPMVVNFQRIPASTSVDHIEDTHN